VKKYCKLPVLGARLNAQSPPDAVQKFFKAYLEARLKAEPEFATGTGHYENADRWNDWSKARRGRRRASAEETLRELDKFSLATLPDGERAFSRGAAGGRYRDT